MRRLFPLVAHGSGIDDVLWFLVPAVIAMVVVRRAEKKAARRQSATGSPASHSEPTMGPPDDD